MLLRWLERLAVWYLRRRGYACIHVAEVIRATEGFILTSDIWPRKTAAPLPEPPPGRFHLN